MIVSDYEENYVTGWIKIYRSIIKKGWYLDSEYVHLWIHLIIQSTHTEREYLWNSKIIKLMGGQFVTGRKKLSQETGINESKIERILNLFETEQQIEQQKTATSRLISITNFNIYQTSEQANEQRSNNGRTTDEQRMNTKQELKQCKELKNDKNVIIPPKSEFLNYCKEVLKEKYLPLEFSLKAKYESWAENKWKDGNGNKIKNWKTKIKNTIPYLKPEQTKFQSPTPKFEKPIDSEAKYERELQRYKQMKESGLIK